MVLDRVEEFQITESQHQQIRSLLQLSFETYPDSQDFLHQKPAFRYLLHHGKTLTGHLAVDYRIIQLDGKPLSIFGITDLCVDPEYQHQQCASKMISALEKLAIKHKVDAMVLFSNLFDFYGKLGFSKQQNKVRWLMIEKELDLLGHVF